MSHCCIFPATGAPLLKCKHSLFFNSHRLFLLLYCNIEARVEFEDTHCTIVPNEEDSVQTRCPLNENMNSMPITSASQYRTWYKYTATTQVLTINYKI